jgi:hypothetical protein
VGQLLRLARRFVAAPSYVQVGPQQRAARRWVARRRVRNIDMTAAWRRERGEGGAAAPGAACVPEEDV